MHGHQAGHPAALGELAADQVARALRRDHADVDAGRRLDLAEVDREAVGEHQQVAGGDPVPDLGLPDLGLLLVRQQDHHHVAAAGRLGHVEHLSPSASASARLAESGRRPTTTSQPESRRFSAWAWPCDP